VQRQQGIHVIELTARRQRLAAAASLLGRLEPTFRTRFMNKSAGIEGRERR
jgi:hypothetical protein